MNLRLPLKSLSCFILPACLAATLCAAAQAPAGAPTGATGICKDGTYSTARSKDGACRGHKGVQTWYAASVSSMPAPTPSTMKSQPAPTPASTTRSMPAPQPGGTPMQPAPTPAAQVPSRPAPAAAASTPSRPAPVPSASVPSLPAPQSGSKPDVASESARLKAGPAAPGGGPGLVWVNTSSKVYHCPGSDFYGKTKAGSYMTEADAKAQGARANRNKPCS